jgi:hypothetical protein
MMQGYTVLRVSLMFYKKNTFKYIIIFISLLVYYYISLVIVGFTLLLGFYYSDTYSLLICTGVPVFLLAKFFIKKIIKRKYIECAVIFLFILFELIFLPYDIFHKNVRTFKNDDFNTVINKVIHDYYSPIFGR